MHQDYPSRYGLKANPSLKSLAVQSIFQVHHLNRQARGSYKNILPHIKYKHRPEQPTMPNSDCLSNANEYSTVLHHKSLQKAQSIWSLNSSMETQLLRSQQKSLNTSGSGLVNLKPSFSQYLQEAKAASLKWNDIRARSEQKLQALD